MKKKELEIQFQDLRHIILNGIMDMKYLIRHSMLKELSDKCKEIEKAVKELGSNIEVNNNDNNKT